MQHLRPNVIAGASSHPTMTAASSEGGCVQVWALIGSSVRPINHLGSLLVIFL